MSGNIVPFRSQPAPENQPVKQQYIEPPWRNIRRQLFKLFAEGRFTDPFNRETAAIILGPGIIGPAEPVFFKPGILYITGYTNRYFSRASREFRAFHLTYYGWDIGTPESFSPLDLSTYRQVFFWERAKKTYNSDRLRNLRQNK